MHVRKFLEDCIKYVQRNANSVYRGWKGELINIPKELTMFDFKQPETIENFVLLTDKEIGGGSTASLSVSKHGRLLFSGHITTEIQNDAEIDHSGFAGIISKPMKGLFNKTEFFDIDFYDAIDIKYRGDGRCFFVNFQTESLVLSKYDIFQSFLFSKGGPFWESERIPFTKFIRTYQGYLQEVQPRLNKIKTVGISLSDKKTGPFCLEIEHIKLKHVGFQPIIFKHQDPKSKGYASW